MDNKMTYSDLIYPAGSRMDENNMESSDLAVKWTEKYLNNNKKDPYFYTEKGLLDDFEIVDGKKVKEIIGYFEDKDGDEDSEVIGYVYSKSGKDIGNEYSEEDLDDAFTSALTSSRMNEDNMELSPANGDSSAEGQFNQLMSKYDWYYEMSDDSRDRDMGSVMDQKLKSLAKAIGIDRAVELFNDKAPSDRKVTTTFFAENKHAKLKEILKKGLKELMTSSDITAAKLAGKSINVSKSNKQDISALQNAKANFTTYE
jgi:hypothetical protein